MPHVWVAGSALVERLCKWQSMLMQAHQEVPPDDDVDFGNRNAGAVVRLIHLHGKDGDYMLLLKDPNRRPETDLAGALRGPRIDMQHPHNVSELALGGGVRVDPEDIGIIFAEGGPIREARIGWGVITTKQPRA